MDGYLLSCAAASEGTSPAKPDMTVAAARQCLPSMYRPWKPQTQTQTHTSHLKKTNILLKP